MEPAEPTLVPEQFGSLQEVRILSTGTIVAEPVPVGYDNDLVYEDLLGISPQTLRDLASCGVI